jgi:hypothetical protein
LFLIIPMQIELVVAVKVLHYSYGLYRRRIKKRT